jgi:hypothetical protein
MLGFAYRSGWRPGIVIHKLSIAIVITLVATCILDNYYLYNDSKQAMSYFYPLFMDNALLICILTLRKVEAKKYSNRWNIILSKLGNY